MAAKTMDIKLLERNYKVACPVGQESALQQAADALNRRLEETKERTQLTNVEQIAVMTALNLCHDSRPKRPSLKRKFNCFRRQLNRR
ncbi:cell division protein ZapA [Idiomarina piscisalsi]|uniref:cell division protein ZapA n=1 Tax=Idiomarina piscisalsi TaxID=1096243 RepID=UPI001E3B1B09|nr:cell division protein ZapA [Idiomarina piscisalsi]